MESSWVEIAATLARLSAGSSAAPFSRSLRRMPFSFDQKAITDNLHVHVPELQRQAVRAVPSRNVAATVEDEVGSRCRSSWSSTVVRRAITRAPAAFPARTPAGILFQDDAVFRAWSTSSNRYYLRNGFGVAVCVSPFSGHHRDSG